MRATSYSNKTKIISILPHAPNYEAYINYPRPPVNWDTPNGSWVAIAGYDWPDLLGNEILRLSDRFEYEVWQPDFRADRIYEHKFATGLMHKLIPAYSHNRLVGFKKMKGIDASCMVNYLLKTNTSKIIINTNGGLDEFNLNIIKGLKKFPLVHTFRSEIVLPSQLIFRLRKNILSAIYYCKQNILLSQIINDIDFITYMNDKNVDRLEKIYKGPKEKITSGCDFDFWKKMDKQLSREKLKLPLDKYTIFASSRLVSIKQLDKIIEIFDSLSSKYDFLIIISGTGEQNYIAYLERISRNLKNRDQIRFVGYSTGEELLHYYSSSDLFIHTSEVEGAPNSVMKALACELPVFSTNVGHTAEVMLRHQVGVIVDKYDYKQWEAELRKILNGKEVKILDRDIARKYYHWPFVAEKFLGVFDRIGIKYY